MENKVVLVTGSSRGIGKATIIEFASKGYNVVIDYIESEIEANKLREYVEENYGVKAITVKCDVSNEEQVKQLVSTVEKTLKVNVIGAFIVSREVSKYMKPGSAIINVSSTNGTKTISPECLDYNISKIGLQSLTRDLAFQFKPNIRVNAIAIGWADTDMNKDLPKDYIEEETAKIYLKRFANPSEIAKTIYFLASEDSSYINGEVLTIDGGY